MRVAAVILTLLFGVAEAESRPAPQAPAVMVEYMYQCGGVVVAIYATGFAHFDRVDFCGSTTPHEANLRRLSPEEIATIEQAIEDSLFESLPPNIMAPLVSTDDSLYQISLNRAGHACQVDLTGLDQLGESKLARRFMQVWTAVDKVIPELTD